VTFNFSATTISSAIASGLPVLVGINSYSGTVDEVVSRLPAPPSASLRAWLQKAAPVPPYRVWPLGLHRYLAPLVENNPYTTTIRTVEVLEERSFVDAARALLFDEKTRAEVRERQGAYRREVARLPKGADLVQAYLKS
jgi:hypothetical protein